MINTYVLNRETNKIELQFSKEEYKALTAEQQKELKRTFLFAGSRKAWVSRSASWHSPAIQLAVKLGFVDGGITGERLSFAEEQERKAEKAEARAERYETYADNAEKRAEGMQAEFNENSKDWSWLTQPNVNSSRGRSFTNQRNKILDRYNRGFEEYRKSEYFREKAITAQETASNGKMQSRSYLSNRIEEGNKFIREIESKIVTAEEKENEEWLTRLLDRMEYEMDKLAYFENALDALGGIQYNSSSLKPGYLVKIRGAWDTVVKANTKTVEVKPSSVPYTLKYAYAEIQDMKIPEGWKEPKPGITENPFNTGDIVTMIFHRGSRMENLYKAFQIIKCTEKSVVIQEIKLENGTPSANDFINSTQERKAVKKHRDGEYVVNYDNGFLFKYNQAV
jgi:hypothetical protein